MATLSAKGAKTKLRILQTASELFHRHGMHAVSPDQVIDASRTGKGQFYHYFRSKEALIHEVLLWQLDALLNGDASQTGNVESWDDLRGWFASHIEIEKRFNMTRACPFGGAANEMTPAEERLREDLQLIFDVAKSQLISFFLHEKAQGRLSIDADETSYADFCIATIEGALLIGKVKRDSNVAEAVVAHALQYLER